MKKILILISLIYSSLFSIQIDFNGGCYTSFGAPRYFYDDNGGSYTMLDITVLEDWRVSSELGTYNILRNISFIQRPANVETTQYDLLVTVPEYYETTFVNTACVVPCEQEKPNYFEKPFIEIKINYDGNTTNAEYKNMCNAYKSDPKYTQVEALIYDVCDVNYKECRGIPKKCDDGEVKNDAGECCDSFGRDSSYSVSQSECGTEQFVKIDNITIVKDFIWNECLNMCTGKSLPACDRGKVYDSNGYCVPPMLDDNDCASAGGILAPYYSRDAVPKNTIVKFNVAKDLDKTKCHNISICKSSDGTNLKDTNGDIIYSSTEVSCGNDDNSTTPDDNVTSNQCGTCPSQYPIPTDAGSCANANGETTYCPTSQDNGDDGANDSNVSDGSNPGNTNDNNIKCGTCSLLGAAIKKGSWSATGWKGGNNGMCERTTINGITQISPCPTAPKNDNNISITPSDANASLKPGETDISCPCCPKGTKSTASGKCLKILPSGGISMMIPCPCDTKEIPRDQNSTEPLDNNGTDDNATGLQNAFGRDIEREMKKAYKSYTIFDTSDCGELSIQADAYIGDPEASISDPLPLFRDVIAPYRNIIKNFLIFMAVIIGLFDFFKRS